MSHFAKRHYVAIARTIREARSRRASIQNYVTRATHYDEITGELADLFAGDNPRFDRARFIAACEYKREEG